MAKKTASRRSRPAKAARRSAPKAKRKSAKAATKAARSVAAKTPARKAKWVYTFGDGKAEGRARMRDLLGGKGANLAEMANLGLPVPPGFSITTELCTYFYANGKTYPKELKTQVESALAHIGKITGKSFGDARNPLLVSVRSGAKFSMPGMMDTVLNLGLNDTTVAGLAEHYGDERFAADAYRRFVQMFGKIVMGVPGERFEHEIEAVKKARGVSSDTELGVEDLTGLMTRFKEIATAEAGVDFPDDPMTQLEMAIRAVFESWNGERARIYRRKNKIADDLGTAVNVVAMVFGNVGENSGTGVAFTRDASTGDKKYLAEYLPQAQGEDVVSGARTPLSLDELKRSDPASYKELV